MPRKKIGVFICHCGMNIASAVDVEKVAEEMSRYPGVAHAEHYIYMCSDPGQALVRKAIQEKGLDGIVMSNCSPSLHLNTFRRLISSEGLNPYHCEVANIREWCSWPHTHERELATHKAINIIKGTVERLRWNMGLEPMVVPLTKKVLIVGAGVAGMQVALDIANSGYHVFLVERQPHIGGHATQLSGMVLTLDSALCNLNPMMQEVVDHPNITLFTYSEIEEVDGYVGNFNVKVKSKSKYVDWHVCDGCSKCLEVCPVSVPSEFDRGLGNRKAIYRTYDGAFPNMPIIDAQTCLRFQNGDCDLCQKACPLKAIDFGQQESIHEVSVGAIIVATGYDLYDKRNLTEYAQDPDVLDSLQFERLLSPTGPTGGQIRRPSDGKVPKEVVFVKCSGSRDPEHHFPYCSRFCCMYTAKQAILHKRQVPEGQAYVFYMDIRSTSKGYEEFIKQGIEDNRLIYLRGRVSKIFRDGDKLKVWGVDTLSGMSVEVEADMVVLAMAATGSEGNKKLGKKLNIIIDDYGFAVEAHPKLGPLETLTFGIYLCGSAQAPKDIPDTIYQASGAASKVLSLFSRKELLHNPEIAYVDTEVCAGCGYCEAICAYQAPHVDPRLRVSVVNEAVCEGCGACAAACPSGAMQLRNFTNRQVFDMISVATQDFEVVTD